MTTTFKDHDDSHSATATLGGGCFWCLEPVFARLRGVLNVESGYSGGARPNPSYEQVCSGATGHVEVIRIRFDPDTVGFADLLNVFFKIHDPTTLDRQGNDVGSQYRSVVFYHDAAQQAVAQALIARLDAEQAFASRIVTAVEPLVNYYPAEPYHQRYFENNPRQPYCALVVAPKVEKAGTLFGHLLK
ncbi:MAG: peptide-methionine (S)-S-oxide reductase MsrA [Burkholderiaceae bacterium]